MHTNIYDYQNIILMWNIIIQQLFIFVIYLMRSYTIL